MKQYRDSDDIRRRIGELISELDTETAIGILGEEGNPYILLVRPELRGTSGISVSLDNLRGDWKSAALSVMLLGTQINITKYGKIVGCLIRHPDNPHPALKYKEK